MLFHWSRFRYEKEIFMVRQHKTKNNANKKARVIIFLLFWGGIGLLCLAVLATIELVQLHAFGTETTGTVIRQDIVKEKVTKHINGRDRRIEEDRWDAIVSFSVENDTFTIRSWDGGSDGPLYPTGSELTVVYHSRNPQKGRIKREMSGIRGVFGPMILIIFGTALIGTSKLLKKF
jgi:hypothetical protein